MCRNETALKAANVVVKGLAIVAQAYKAVELALKWIDGALKAMNAVMKCAIVAGTIISIAMTWVSFGLIFASNGGMGSPAVANALVTAIVMTIYLTILCIIICVPIVGQIIGAIMAVIDAIFYIFTLLFTGKGMTMMEAILKIFYDAELCVDFAKDEDDNLVISYGEYEMSLSDQDHGLVDGNTFIVSSPFLGYLVETEFGNSDDLAKSSIEGTLSEFYDYYKPEELASIFPSQDKHTDATCVNEGSQIYCTNTAAIGYVLTPKINGIVPVQAVIDYTIVWGAFGGGGAWRYSTHTMEGILPEEANIKPTFLYLDVLPNSVTDLWNWSELDNYDPDGDGLNSDLEDQLGTSSTNWDYDCDSLSDSYELEIGTNPLASDTDQDGLNDDLEIRIRSNPTLADSDGDGLDDGMEVRHFDPISETMIGGWQVTINETTFWVSSDPNVVDTDGDDLTDYEEKVNGLSPNAPNQLVPVMNLEVKPLNAEPGEYAGAYWEPGQNVEINIALANGTPDVVNTNLTLTLPAFLENAQVGIIDGDRTPLLTVNGNQLIWSFSEETALQSFEFITIPITATTNTTSGNSLIEASLPFGSITLDKTVNVVQDNDNPDAAIFAPMNNAYLRGSNYVIGGTASDPTTWITKTELSIVKQGTASNFQDLSSISSMWAYSWDLPEDGVYSLVARATDRMGHMNTSPELSVTVDNTLPTVTLSSTMDGDTVHLSGTAFDSPAGISYVRLSIDGQPWRSVPFSGSTWSYDWAVVESAQGEHEVSVLAVDRCGNQNSTGPSIINVDSVAPSSIVNSGADFDVPPEVKANTDFIISGVADDGGHLPQPSAPATLTTGMNVFDDSTLWLGISNIHDNDGGVLATWIGDFNSDRMADLAVGLPGPDGSTGQVALLYGKAGGWTTPPDLQMLANSPTRFNGVSGARLGSYLAAAGDTNADNLFDLLIGERNSDRAFLIFGNPGSLGQVILEGGHSGYRTMLQAPATIDGLAGAGDVNGDGYSDLLVQAGGTAYLIFGQTNPWPETIELANNNNAVFSNTTGALGVGDVDHDQLDEWVILKNGTVTLYGWNSYTSAVESVSILSTSDTDPHAVALGDVNGDEKADWLFSNGDNRILVYGSGATHTFYGYDGFFAAPGDIDGDDRADILLTTSAGTASLVNEPNGEFLTEFATIGGVGGSASAFYVGGADLNSDGSDDLLLIPTQSAAEERGFDAPDFSSGFISPQSLPLGASLVGGSSPGERLLSLNAEEFQALSTGQDTRYVDDDAVNNSCNGFSPCYTTIQAAINASDGGRDIIIIYPGVYASFSVPYGFNYDHLIIEGLNADAVFVDGGGTANAITVSADGVHLSNLTIRNATNGIYLDYGAGEPPVGSGNEIVVDHVITHSVTTPIAMNGLSALTLSDSTLVGNGIDPILSVAAAPANIYYWGTDQQVPVNINSNGTLISAGNNLYALPGGGNSNVYPATPASGGGVSSWGTPFNLRDPLPTSTGTEPVRQGTNLMVGGATTISQLHSNFVMPDLGGLANHEIDALAFAPNGDIYAGGRFTKIGTSEFFYLARWDGTKWNKIGTGLEPNGAVLALVFDNTGNNLYVGGEFTRVGTKDVGHVARWNLASKSWSVLGTEGWWTYWTPNILMNGVDGPVNALAYDAVYNRVFIGGSFTNATEYGSSSGLNTTQSNNLAAWSVNCTPSLSSICYQDYPRIGVNGVVNALALGNGRLYVGGSFTAAALGSYYQLATSNIAYYNLSSSSNSGAWTRLGTSLTNPVKDIALLSQNQVAVASGSQIWEWDGSSTWSLAGGSTYGANSVAVDNNGNVYTANNSGYIKIQYGGSGSFETMTEYGYFYSTPGGWGLSCSTLEVDSSGQLYAGAFGWDYYNSRPNGAVSRFSLASFYRRSSSGGSWSRLQYPPTPSPADAPFAVVADNGDNLYAIWGYTTSGRLYYYNAATATWLQKANPPSSMTLYHLLWAGSSLYALGQSTSPYSWHLLRYDPGTNTWTELTKPLIPDGVNTSGLSWVWDGADHFYLMRGDGTSDFMRYSISTNAWESLNSPSFSITYGPAAARIGSYLYVYGPMGVTSNFYRYGALPASDLRLAIDRTAFVMPNTATSLNWTSLSSAAGRQFFLTDIDTSNTWVAPSAVSASPALPTGATRLTSTQADFVAPTDGLYRLGASSTLTAGYHHFNALAHVYPSQAACTLCTSSLTWGVDAFDTIRQAIESGAARVLVHPGIYPQTFYLVSGVEVIGSGAENTILESPPSGTAATLVTAEGVAHATLARITLTGGAAWSGFLAEGGTKGLKLTRTIIRDLDTGVRLRGNSQVEVVNNTFVRNAYGLAAEGTNQASVRNTIFAYNTSIGLQNSTGITNTYNDYWSNTKDMDPSILSLGSLFINPRFISPEDNDLRLGDNSSVIDKGAPGDPTVPGGGQRVDMGYAEYNTAGFYVSQNYSETSLNDGLTWNVDAFAQIQPALDAAATAMNDLQGVLPEGGYSVAVDTGTYSGNLMVPSYVRLIGSGPAVTSITAPTSGNAVTFDGVIGSELSGFTIQNAISGSAGVELKGAASGITIDHNVIYSNASYGIKLSGQSSAEVLFNTILNNNSAGIYATGVNTWVDVCNNILVGNATGLQAVSGALVRNEYNLLQNTTNLSGVTAGTGTLTGDPAFVSASYYVPSAVSPAIDAGDPLAAVPPAGGLRADLGYKELIASPLTLLFGPQIKSTVSLGNAGVAKVEVGVVQVTDTTIPPMDTLPTTWQTLTPSQSGQPLFYWSLTTSKSTAGYYRVYSRATDARDNTESDENDWYEGAFVVDSTAPTLSFTLNPSGTTTATATLATAIVSGSVSTGTGTRSDVRQIYFNVSGPAGTASYPADNGQAWIPLPVVGTYTVTAIAVDEAGNQAQQSRTVTVISSNSVVTVTSPPNDTAVAKRNILLQGYVRFTGAGNGQINVIVTGGSSVAAVLGSPGAAFSSWSAQVTLPTGDGVKTIKVTPSLNGVTGTDATLNLTLDTTPPVLAVTTPAAGTYVQQNVTFSGTASDLGSGLKRVEVSVDGGYTWRQASLNAVSWSLIWDLGLDQDFVSYPAQVRAVDAVGNSTVIKNPVAVDNLPPTGLQPVTFNYPVGEHLEDGTELIVNWHTPIDASGSVQVLMDVNMDPPMVNDLESVPTTSRTGNNSARILDTVGEWYVHIMAQDLAGNQTLTHYGPWYVEDLSDEILNNRHKSVVIDGFIDMGLQEWKTNELLGEDARSGHPQKLYASWDGEYIYLGWSSAWWTLDGILWAYLDTVENAGTNFRQDGVALPPNLLADQAVEITAPDEGLLWTWMNGSWVEQPLDSTDFANGPTGDTEMRVAWYPAPSQKLNLEAYALPRAAEDIQLTQSSTVASEEKLAEEGMEFTSSVQYDITPWALFPTTNALDNPTSESFSWSATDLTSSNPNQNLPRARTIYMTVTSPQAKKTAWISGSEIDYSITLTNPEPTDFSNLVISLNATSGLAYQSQSGATCTSCTDENSWTLIVENLAANETKTIFVESKITNLTSSLNKVSSAFDLSSGATMFTHESKVYETVTHRVDGQGPTVTIDALDGSVMPGGTVTFTGTAKDKSNDGHSGSGVVSVEVSLNGTDWMSAEGTKAWSITLTVSNSPVTMQVRARDLSGILSSVVSHTFYIDSTPPTVTWTLPPLTTNKKAPISGTVQDQGPDGSQVHSVEVQIDETGRWYKAHLMKSDNGTQKWVWSWLTPKYDGATHKLRVRATDDAGNTTITASQSTLVDVSGPQITITQRLSTVMLPNDPGAVALTSFFNSGGDFNLFLPLVTNFNNSSQPSVIIPPLVADSSEEAATQAADDGTVTLLAGTIAESSGLAYFIVKITGPGGGSKTDIIPVDEAWDYTPDITGWKVGTHRVRVIAKDNNNNITLLGPFLLQVQDAPITNLKATNDSPHDVNEAVTFTATIASGSNVSYTWDFGDGKSDKGRTVTHTYTDFGTFTATVKAENSNNTMTASTTVTIIASLQTGPVFTVNSIAGTNDHRCDESDCTLREAIEAANNDGKDSTIELSKLDYGLSELDNAENQSGNSTINLLPKITTNITINGHGAHIYRMEEIQNGRFFSVPNETVLLTLNEVWLQDGKVDSTSSQTGGAINNYGTLTVKNSLLEGNEAQSGGAIYNVGTLKSV